MISYKGWFDYPKIFYAALAQFIRIFRAFRAFAEHGNRRRQALIGLANPKKPIPSSPPFPKPRSEQLKEYLKINSR